MKKLLLSTALIGALFVTTSQADVSTIPTNYQFGVSSYSVGDTDSVGANIAGMFGFKFGESVSLEGGFEGFFSGDYIGVGVIGEVNYLINKNIKVGVGFTGDTVSNHGIGFLYGANGQYNFNDHNGIRLEYRTGTISDVDIDYDATKATLSYVYIP